MEVINAHIGSFCQIVQVTDCSFFYFNRHLLDASLKDLLENPHEARKLPILIQAFLDGHRLLKKTSLDVYTTHKVIHIANCCFEVSGSLDSCPFLAQTSFLLLLKRWSRLSFDCLLVGSNSVHQMWNNGWRISKVFVPSLPELLRGCSGLSAPRRQELVTLLYIQSIL